MVGSVADHGSGEVDNGSQAFAHRDVQVAVAIDAAHYMVGDVGLG